MKRKNKRLFKIISAIAFVVIGYLVAAVFFSLPPFAKKINNYKDNTLITTENNKTIQDQPTKQDNSSEQNSNNKTPVQNEGTNPNKSETVTGYISAKNLNNEQQILSIRVVINQFLDNHGQCELTLTKADKKYTESARIINNPSSSTCEGFDISLEKLSKGEWDIKIKIDTKDKTGVIDGGKVEI